MVMLLLPNFLLSFEYLTWCFSIQITNDFLSQSLKHLLERKQYMNSEVEKFANREILHHSSSHYIHPPCRKYIMESLYLYNFIRAVDSLPIGITISEVVRNPRVGYEEFEFPIIYVNEMYSIMTGYNRRTALGENFAELHENSKFGQGNKNDELFAHLQLGATHINASHVFGMNKSPFLVGIKPIYDSEGTYCYVIGIHIDITFEYDFFWSDEMLHYILSKIPNRLNQQELPAQLNKCYNNIDSVNIL